MRYLGFFGGIVFALLIVAGVVYLWTGMSQQVVPQAVFTQDNPAGGAADRPGGRDRGDRGDRAAMRGRGGPMGMMGGARGFMPGQGELEEFIDLLGEANLRVGFDLTRDQKEHLQAIREGYRSAVEKWQKENEAAFAKLVEEMQALRRDGSREDWQAIREKQQKLVATAPSAEQTIEQIRQLLTAEQQKVLQEMQEKAQAEREEMRRQLEERMNRMRRDQDQQPRQ